MLIFLLSFFMIFSENSIKNIKNMTIQGKNSEIVKKILKKHINNESSNILSVKYEITKWNNNAKVVINITLNNTTKKRILYKKMTTHTDLDKEIYIKIAKIISDTIFVMK